jgi:hypothetical protein
VTLLCRAQLSVLPRLAYELEKMKVTPEAPPSKILWRHRQEAVSAMADRVAVFLHPPVSAQLLGPAAPLPVTPPLPHDPLRRDGILA